MLSFDITDRNIRIIKGTESSGKIKISAAATLNLEEAVIVNGHVNDINRVAMMINQVLKTNNMFDKEAIISISSNQTVFKELMIPPNPKESEFMKSVRHELQVQINVDDSYAVAYVIVGDPEEGENGEKLQRILATACPYDVVDCYKRVFHMLDISLKSVTIGCNSITKVLLADVKIKTKMPLLAVQIDENFISLNLYEDNQLSFSRFASIDPEDYDDPDDYVFQAINENIFRMLQFSRSRGSDQIENVVFYGNLEASPGLYNRLIDEMGSNEIAVSQLKPPPQIHGYQNLEFAEYANAIGAMFKRNKITEHINLLETGGGAAAKSAAGGNDKSFGVVAAVSLIASLAVVGGAYAAMAIVDNNVKNDTKKLREIIDSPETAASLRLYEELQVKRDNVNAYAKSIATASAAYKSQSVLSTDVLAAIDDALQKTDESLDTAAEAKIEELEYDENVATIRVSYKTTEELSQKFPASMTQYLYDTYSNLFDEVAYEGYLRSITVMSDIPNPGDPFADANTYSFDLGLTLKQDTAPDVSAEEVVEETTEAATAAAAQ